MLDESGNEKLQKGANAQQPPVATGEFRLSLLGPFSLLDTSGQALEVTSRKNRVLLAMLALAPERSISRDKLAGVLWSENGEEQAKNSLRQSLAVLRKHLKGQEETFFAGVDGSVTLHPERVILDTDLFLKNLEQATRQSLERAIGLWRGPFMADVTAPEHEIDQWLAERREYFNTRYLMAMDRLAPLLDGAARIVMAQRLVQADTLREGSHRQLMEAYFASGEKAQALRHYDKLRRMLRDELGVEPSPDTQALRDAIASAGNKVTAAIQAPMAAEATTVYTDATAAAPLPASLSAARRRLPVVTLTALLLLVAAAAAVWFMTRPQPSTDGPPAVAVLPFESLSGDAADARLAKGLTIDTITDLSRYQDFRVMAKDTTEIYKGKPVDIRALGEDLKVSHVLKGTFQRESDHIRVTAQLIDASTGETLWSDRYDRLIGEIFAVQSDVADHIANSLGGRAGKLGESMLASAKRKPPADLDAYELYLLAQETMYSDLSAKSMRGGQKILEQAIAKDPSFARAYVRYANTFAWLATTEANSAEMFQQMRRYARKAVDLDPLDADAHAALGYSLTLTGDMKQGEAHLDEALRLTPNGFDILIFHSCLAQAYGKLEKGAEAADRAMAINPAYPNWAVPCLRLGLAMVGRYDEVLRIQSRQVEAEWNTDAFVITAGSLAMLGRNAEAELLVSRGIARFPGLLSIERFALNRSWPPQASKVMTDLMRRAGFPACATAKELADLLNPVRLPECMI